MDEPGRPGERRAQGARVRSVAKRLLRKELERANLLKSTSKAKRQEEEEPEYIEHTLDLLEDSYLPEGRIIPDFVQHLSEISNNEKSLDYLSLNQTS